MPALQIIGENRILYFTCCRYVRCGEHLTHHTTDKNKTLARSHWLWCFPWIPPGMEENSSDSIWYDVMTIIVHWILTPRTYEVVKKSPDTWIQNVLVDSAGSGKQLHLLSWSCHKSTLFLLIANLI